METQTKRTGSVIVMSHLQECLFAVDMNMDRILGAIAKLSQKRVGLYLIKALCLEILLKTEQSL